MIRQLVLLLYFFHFAYSTGVVYFQQEKDHTAIEAIEGSSDALQEEILDILHLNDTLLKNRRVKRDEEAVQYMEKLYKELMQPDIRSKSLEEWSSVDSFYTFRPKETERNGNVYAINFSLAELRVLPVVIAELRVAIPIANIRAFVKVTLVNTNGNVLDTAMLTTHTNSVGFNVTRIVEQWLKNGKPTPILMRIDSVSGSEVERPFECFLVVGYVEKAVPIQRRRSKRAVDTTQISPPRKTKRIVPLTDFNSQDQEICRRQGLYIDFKKLNWNEWVIAPEGFSAEFCGGTCRKLPLYQKMNATNHAIIQSMVHELHPTRAEPAKCVAVSMDHLRILFTDDKNSVVLKRYRDMVVSSCGCL